MANKRAKHAQAKGLVLAAASADGDELVLEVHAAAGTETLRVVLSGVEAAEDLASRPHSPRRARGPIGASPQFGIGRFDT